jgi:glycosyltransferase involved in cell wall biosynthesis
MPAPVPVLLLARELDLGGTERQLTEIARTLDREAFEPHAGCFRPHGIRAEQLRRAGVPVAHFPVYSFRSKSAVDGVLAMRRYIQRHGIRLVHAFDVPGVMFGVPVARLCGVQCVLSSQRAFRELIGPGTRRVLRVTDRLAHGIVVNSQAVAKDLVETDGVRPDKLHLCYNGLDMTVFHPPCGPVSKPASLGAASVVIGVVCAVRKEKGLDILLRAFAGVRRLHQDVRLAIVGGGPALAELQALALELGVAADVHFEAPTPDVTPWLHAIDVFVLPSLSEALSNSLMEAMACGCCAIASGTGGNPELVRHGETGLLFESRNVEDLERRLLEAIGDPALRAKLGQAASRRMAEEFSLAASAARMAEIYRSFLR